MKMSEPIARDTANGSGHTFTGPMVLNENAPFVEELYQRYLANPDAVDDDWLACCN